MESKPSLPILFPVDPEIFWERLRSVIHEEIRKVAIEKINTPKEEPLLTRKEIASFLKISLVTLHDCMKRRGLPFHRKSWGPRFLKSEVLQWLKDVKNGKKGAD